MKTRALAAMAAAAVMSVSTLAARGQSPQQPLFRSNARLVQVSVIVQDGRGRPVPGLTANDFEIIDSGKKHPVAHFAVEARDVSRSPLGSVPPGAFTNVLDGRIGTGATVLLFDRLNTFGQDQILAKRHVVEYIQRLRPEERIGFYVLDSNALRIVHDFTGDAAVLLKRLNHMWSATSVELARAEDRLHRPENIGDARIDEIFNEMLVRSESAMQGFSTESRVKTTVDVLEILAERLSGVRGRKNVIWISGGFPLTFHDGISERQMSPEVYRATRALSHADISIYPVDARGLIGGLAGVPGRHTHVTLSTLAPTFDTSSIIADQTGGRAYRNTNDLRNAIARAVNDSVLTYQLGYYPQDETFDGRYRSIDVKVKRRGVDVRHRNGYYAHPPKVATMEADELVRALQFPVEATSLGVVVTHQPLPTGEIKLSMTLNATELSLQRQGDDWTGKLEVAIGQRLDDRRVRNSLHATVPVVVPESAGGQFFERGLMLHRTITLDPEARLVIVGVRDLGSGAIGTVRIDAAALRAGVR